ncbi:MAG TPA: hypothetical protein VF609_07835 [Flavisolibacter sp.]
MGKVCILFLSLFALISIKAASQQRLLLQSDSISRAVSLKVLPQNFYNQHLSFVCKKEVQLQKLTSLPIYFRIGSKDYVDYLEKKPNAIGNRQ